jgi:hypothetical protein
MTRVYFHAVYNEKTMFMKWEGSDHKMRGLFVNDMMHPSTSEKMMAKFLKLYDKTLEYIGGFDEDIPWYGS